MTIFKEAILLVDDDQRVLRQLRFGLKDSDFDLYFTQSPIEAMGIILSYPIDVLVSDLRMPLMNGCELLQYSALASPQTSRVVCTGAMGNFSSELNNREIDVLLQKPIQPHRLQLVIEDLLEKKLSIKNVVRVGEKISPEPDELFENERREALLATLKVLMSRDGTDLNQINFCRKLMRLLCDRLSSPDRVTKHLEYAVLVSLLDEAEISFLRAHLSSNIFFTDNLTNYSLKFGGCREAQIMVLLIRDCCFLHLEEQDTWEIVKARLSHKRQYFGCEFLNSLEEIDEDDFQGCIA
ncbi:MAG: response regulator [Pseudomonadales bacterium]|nr:response regulator [Pseudomonadales bacterium]MBO7005972.1 response regulator [Pseudomonadales bacterium]